MKSPVLVDTGPLVALFNRRDRFHDWAVGHFKVLTPPLFTCDGVLAEAFYLLRDDRQSIPFLFGLIERKVVVAQFSVGDESLALKKLMKKYPDTPMDLADACLVRMSELHSESFVWTLDSDFRIYRRNGRARIPVIIPE